MIGKELIKNLQEQKNNLKTLLNSAVKKQKALVNFNYDDLEKSIQAEEKTLFHIQKLETERSAQISGFYLKNSIPHDSLKVNELLQRVNGTISQENREIINSLEKEIKELILEINKVNIQNTFLTEHSRAFIKETITSLVSVTKQHLDRKV